MSEDASKNAIHIREATAEDANDIHSMIKALAEGMGMGEQIRSTPEDFRDYGFGSRPAFEALIAERAGTAIGLCLYFYSFSSWAGKRGVYVQDIYVDKSARGTGLGRRLLAETARRAAAQGAAFMRLAVDKDNQSARDFYLNAGMVLAELDLIYKDCNEAFTALQKIEGS
jgi:GNAT superfamily N-acetyltransferase